MEKFSNYLWFIVFFLLGILLASFLVNFLRDSLLFQDFLMKKFYFWGALILIGFLLVYLWFSFNFFKILFCFLAFVLGFGRFWLSLDLPENAVSNYIGEIVLEGCISGEVDVRFDKVKYIFEVFKVFPKVSDGDLEDVFPEAQDVQGKILVNGNRYPVYQFGQCFLLEGDLQLPGKIEDFDYSGYLARYRVFSLMNYPKFSPLKNKNFEDFFESENSGTASLKKLRFWFFEQIFGLKMVFEQRIAELWGEPSASFISGLLLGSRKGIPEHLMNKFDLTGLTHIIAISGYNITILIVVISGIFGFMSRKHKILVSVLVILVFVFLVGASAAVIRAAIMGVISLLALWSGRSYFVEIALFSSAFLMNLINPRILFFDVGFQLSFLATAGLIYISPLIEKYFHWLPDVFGIKESILMTISAQILALPVILINFERLSLISPLANLFVLPWIPLAMLLGFFALIVSFISRFLASILAFLTQILLEIMIFFVEIFASLEFASVEVTFVKIWMFFLYYYFVLKLIIRYRLVPP